MRAALKMAKEITGGDVKVDYVNAHGTSTPANDKNESAALKELFGGKESCPPVSSTKGATGHCLGAAGAIEAVITLMAMRDGVLPPTINYTTPDLENGCDLDYVPNKLRKAEITTAMSNSFGFGGTNGVVIFKKV
jgi:3-oxoacyl-[acyl-carrier-protein] synthase II